MFERLGGDLLTLTIGSSPDPGSPSVPSRSPLGPPHPHPLLSSRPVEKLSKFSCLPANGGQRPSSLVTVAPRTAPFPSVERTDGLRSSRPVRTQRRNGQNVGEVLMYYQKWVAELRRWRPCRETVGQTAGPSGRNFSCVLGEAGGTLLSDLIWADTGDSVVGGADVHVHAAMARAGTKLGEHGNQGCRQQGTVRCSHILFTVVSPVLPFILLAPLP